MYTFVAVTTFGWGLLCSLHHTAVAQEVDHSADGYNFNTQVNMSWPVFNGWFRTVPVNWTGIPLDQMLSLPYGAMPFNISFEGTPWSEYEEGIAGVGRPKYFTNYTYLDEEAIIEQLNLSVPDQYNSILPRFMSGTIIASGAYAYGVQHPVNGSMNVSTGIYVSNRWRQKYPKDGPLLGSTAAGLITSSGEALMLGVSIRGEKEGGMYYEINDVVVTTPLQLDVVPPANGTGLYNVTLDDMQTQVLYFVEDGKVNPAFTCTADWNITKTIGLRQNIEYASVQSSGGRASKCSLQIPSNVAYIIVNGTMGPGYGGLDISLQPAFYDYQGTRASDQPQLSSWVIYPNAPIWRWQNQMLGINRTMLFQKLNNNNMTTGLSSVTFIMSTPKESSKLPIIRNNSTASPNPNPSPNAETQSSSGASTGTIAGAVIGSVLGTALLAVLLVWCLRQRTIRNRRAEPFRPDLIDDYHVHPLDPAAMAMLPNANASTRYKGQRSRGEMARASGSDGSSEGSDNHEPRPVIREEDGGAIRPAAFDIIPPLYNPAWAESGSSDVPLVDVSTAHPTGDEEPRQTEPLPEKWLDKWGPHRS